MYVWHEPISQERAACDRELGPRMARAITQCDREVCIQALARGHGRETQSHGGNLDGITYVAGTVSNRKSARVKYRRSTSQIFGGGAWKRS